MIRTSGDSNVLAPLAIPPGDCNVHRWSELTDPQRDRLEELAFAWGETYDAYLVNSTDRSYYFLPDGLGALAYRRFGSHVLIVGGLLGSPDDRPRLLRAFLDFARRKWWTLNFFNLPRDHIGLFREFGFEVSKCGEEPFICLDETDWKGSAYSWLRRQENFCLRQGCLVEELTELAAEDRLQLERISEQHVQGTLQGREMSFFVGRFDADSLRRRRIFVARDQERRIIAFVMCNPGLRGAMWAVEAYRRAPDAPRGVIPFAILRTMRLLQAEGVRYVSLSLCPCLRSGVHGTPGNFFFRYLCDTWWHRMNWIFDVQGIYHFKSRFRPRFRESFLASYPKTTFGAMMAIPYQWGLFAFNPLRLFRRGLFPKANRDLAQPPARPERLIKRLKVEDWTPRPTAAELNASSTPEAST